jgi:hypothetical protein
MEVPIMVKRHKSVDETEFFSVSLAKWVTGVLGMLIAVVGQESLLGLILRQTRSEIKSLVRDEENSAVSTGHPWFQNN